MKSTDSNKKELLSEIPMSVYKRAATIISFVLRTIDSTDCGRHDEYCGERAESILKNAERLPIGSYELNNTCVYGRILCIAIIHRELLIGSFLESLDNKCGAGKSVMLEVLLSDSDAFLIYRKFESKVDDNNNEEFLCTNPDSDVFIIPDETFDRHV